MITKAITSWTKDNDKWQNFTMEIVFTSYGDKTDVSSRISSIQWTKLEDLFSIKTSELKLLINKL